MEFDIDKMGLELLFLPKFCSHIWFEKKMQLFLKSEWILSLKRIIGIVIKNVYLDNYAF